MIGNKKKKILFIVQLPPPVHGAGIMNSCLVNSELIRQNFSVDLINLKFSKSLRTLKKFSFIKVIKSLVYSIKIIIKVLLRRHDLVYFTFTPTGYAFYRDAFYVGVLKLLNRKIVFHLHAKGIKNNADKNHLTKQIYKWVFNNVNVICLSENLSLDIETITKLRPYIVPNGIKVQEKYIRDNNLKTDSIPQILFLSNYIESKGLYVLIEALHTLKNNGYIFNARLVGAPSDLTVEMLEKIILEQDLTEFITVVGPKYGQDKINEYKNADIFVFPTYYEDEAFPLVILEAMQFSLPVISTFEGGIPNMVKAGETGLLVENRNVKMLAENISLLLRNKKMRIQMGEKGYEAFRNNFTLNHFEKNMVSSLNDILKNSDKK